jgi:hypothetical protein
MASMAPWPRSTLVQIRLMSVIDHRTLSCLVEVIGSLGVEPVGSPSHPRCYVSGRQGCKGKRGSPTQVGSVHDRRQCFPLPMLSRCFPKGLTSLNFLKRRRRVVSTEQLSYVTRTH